MNNSRNSFWLNDKQRLSIPVVLFMFVVLTVCLFFINAFVLSTDESRSVIGSYRALMSALFGAGALIYMSIFLLIERAALDRLGLNLLMWQRRIIVFFILDFGFAYFLHRPATDNTSLSYLEYYWRIHTNLSALFIWYLPQATYMIVAYVLEPQSQPRTVHSNDILDDNL